jgi:transposase-like protein
MATRKRHTPEQVVRKLATADRMLGEGKDIAAVCRKLQVSEQTYYRWRNQFGGLKADDAKRLKDWSGRTRRSSVPSVMPNGRRPSSSPQASSLGPRSRPRHPGKPESTQHAGGRRAAA